MDVLDQQEIPHEGRTLENVLTEGYTFDFGDFIGKAFGIYGKDAGLYIGFCLLAGVINYVIGLIPFVNMIGGLLVGPALVGGYYCFMKAKGNDWNGVATFNHFFEGFKQPQWIQLVLAGLVSGIFIGIVVVIVAIPLIITVGFDVIQSMMSMASTPDAEQIQELLGLFLGGKILLMILLVIVVAILVSVIWILAPQFIIFHGMAFWDAMEASRKVVMKNYLKFVLLLFVLAILATVGAILCLVGLLVAIPVMYITLNIAFKHIFSEASRPSGNASL